MPAGDIFCAACGLLTQNLYLPMTLCIPLLPLPAESCTLICSLPWELLVTALCSICHVVNEWWRLHLNYSDDPKQSPRQCLVNVFFLEPPMIFRLWNIKAFECSVLWWQYGINTSSAENDGSITISPHQSHCPEAVPVPLRHSYFSQYFGPFLVHTILYYAR